MLARSARYIAHALPQHITSSSFRCFAMSTVSDLTKLEEVVSFWSTVDQRKKFTKDPDFDTLLIEKYSDLHASLMAGAYDSPLELSPMPALLGAVLVLDQFSRNMFRGSSKSFESDAKALALAKQAISQGCLEKAGLSREWFFLPLMHSEDLDDQNMCVEYFTTSPWGTDFAVKHQAIIEKFGRFPHRNEALGRESTPAEVEFMKENPGF